MKNNGKLYLIISIILVGSLLVFSRADNTPSNKLYDVLKDAYEDGIYARKYGNNHQDSLDNSGNEDIYYWYGSNNTNATAILNKNNVRLGDTCWQMLRTTDTGGVKMIYNGPYDETNKCNSSRSNHKGVIGTNGTTRTLNGSYIYGDSYTYNENTGIFTLTDTITAIWSDSTYQSLIGKYTCANNNSTCTTIYYVGSYYGPTSAYTTSYTVGDTHYSQIGTSTFNANSDSLAMVGYMFNTVYKGQIKNSYDTSFTLSSYSLDTTYWYASDVTWNSNTNRYNLVNPYQVSSTSDYQNLVGKYTFRNTSQTYASSSVYYIAAVNGETMYYIRLDSGKNLAYYNDTYTYGDSYRNNGNGTYTITNQDSSLPTTINTTGWYNNYSNMNNKYVCKNATNDECSDLWYAKETSVTKINYYKVTQPYKYASGFTYENGTYRLNNDYVTFWNLDNSTNKASLNTHHYTCWNETGECTKLSYVYYLREAGIDYIDLTDGKDIEDAKNEMLYNNDVNRYNSSIKGQIEAWYHQNMTDYTDCLEDIIYCNNRSQANASANGWNASSGSITTSMQFEDRSPTASLTCNNVTDQFTTTNTKATLRYPVGLETNREMRIFSSASTLAIKTGQFYWLASPYYLSPGSYVGYVTTSGGTDGHPVYYSISSRPVVSLKSGTKYTSGDGSMNNPYIIEEKPKITTNVTNGTITETTRVESGSNKTITYRPNSGYVIDSILVDGVSVSTSTYKNSYTFTNVTEDHTISVTYRVGTKATFDTGQSVAAKMKTLANGLTKTYYYQDTTIQAIKRGDTLPSGFTPTTGNTVSSSNSDNPIYIWWDSSTHTMYYYSPADIVYLNSDSSSMFCSMKSLTNISDLSEVDTSNVTMMRYTFYNCTNLTDIDALSDWDTSSVTDMSYMFNNCRALPNLDSLSDWDTSNVTDANAMFYDCRSLTEIDALIDWDVSNVTDMYGMFGYCVDLTNIDGALNWDTSKVTNMSSMFDDCTSLENIDGASNWDTSNVTNMYYMFAYCTDLADIDGAANWDTSSVADVSMIFCDCPNASGTFPILGNPTSYSGAFADSATNTGAQITVIYNCVKTTNIDDIIATKSSGSNVVKGSCTATTAEFDTGETVNLKMKNLANNSNFTETYDEDEEIHAIKKGNALPSGFTPSTANTISSSTSENPIYMWWDSTTHTIYYYSEADIIYLNPNSAEMFYWFTALTDISGLSEVDTSKVTNMSYMFATAGDNFSNISALSDWDTSGVTDMSSMFEGTDLTNIDALSDWDVSNVIDMSLMFEGCSDLADIDGASNWDTSSVTNIDSIFYNCPKASGTFPILGNPTSYSSAFEDAATASGSQITVVYNCVKTTNIDNIIATKSNNSNVVKGSCIVTNSDITITNELYGNMASLNKDFTYTVEVRDSNNVIDSNLSTIFTLKNDESEVLSIPMGYSITVTQGSESGYTTTVNDTNSRTITLTVSDDETITYKNTYNMSTQTNVRIFLPPYLVLIILSLLVILGISYYQKKFE